MGARFHSRWQYIRKHWIVAIIIALVIAAIALIFIESLINGTGFNGYYALSTTHTISGPPHTITSTETYQPGKTLWDWLQLLIIPLVIAGGGYLFTLAMKRNEQQNTNDNQQEAALQGYIKEISELILEKDLLKSDKDAEVRIIARVLTLTVLPRLDGRRKRSVLQFLYESKLIERKVRILHESKWIERNVPIVDLAGADFSYANLNHATLISADLSEAKLSHADLSGAILITAKLSHADLSGADLSGAATLHADMTYADLKHANLRGTSLVWALLRGADLNYSDMSGADLRRADLSAAVLHPKEHSIHQRHMYPRARYGADLSGAILNDADFSETDLREAIVTPEQLDTTKSFQDATMPDEAKPPIYSESSYKKDDDEEDDDEESIE